MGAARSWGRRFLIGMLALIALLAAGVASQLRSDIPLEVLKERWANSASQFVELDGMPVHYRDEGSGPAVLLLHGTGSSLHTWDAWTDALRTDHRVVRVDLPGFGLTGPMASGDYRLASYVDFVDHFAANRGLARFTVAGNSLGGGIAWRYAVKHPERVDALILIDASGYPRNTRPVLAFRLAASPGISTVMAQLDPRWLVAKTVRQAYGDPQKVSAEVIERYVQLTLRPGNRGSFAARVSTPFEDRTSDLRSLRIPTLVLWGRKDAIIPVGDAGRFQRDIPGATVRIYDDLGHVPMEEDGARTSADVRAFLDHHSPN